MSLERQRHTSRTDDQSIISQIKLSIRKAVLFFIKGRLALHSIRVEINTQSIGFDEVAIPTLRSY